MAKEEQTQSEIEDALEDDQVTVSSASEEMNDSEALTSVSELQKQVEILKDELEKAQEQSLRAAAEMQNIRRRTDSELEKAHKFGNEKFVNDMLPVADNLERAVQSASVDGVEMASVVEGIELTLKTLADALGRHKVEAVNPEGEPFDPQVHQAMTMIENPDVEPNTVMDVFQKGYTLNGRLVRPAMVVVAKAPANS